MKRDYWLILPGAKKLKAVQQELERSREELRITRATIKARDIEMSVLHTEKVEAQADLLVTRAKVKELEIARTTLQDELARTRVERDEVTEHLTTLIAENAALKTEVERMKHKKLSARPAQEHTTMKKE